MRWGITNNLTLNGTVEPRLLAGRVRRGPVQFDPRPGALLPGEAAVLPRRHRAVHDAELADLHAARRAAGGRGEAHRQDVGHQRRASSPRWTTSPARAIAHAIIRCSTSCACSATSAPASKLGVDVHRPGGRRRRTIASPTWTARYLFGGIYSFQAQYARQLHEAAGWPGAERAALARRHQPERQALRLQLRAGRRARGLPHARAASSTAAAS